MFKVISRPHHPSWVQPYRQYLLAEKHGKRLDGAVSISQGGTDIVHEVVSPDPSMTLDTPMRVGSLSW